MLKFITTILLVGYCLLIHAQNLEQYIPQDSKAVIEFDGEQLFTLVSKSKFEDLFKSMSKDPNASSIDLSDFGFNLNSKAYYFLQQNGDVAYHQILAQVSDASKIEAFLAGIMPGTPTISNGFQHLQNGQQFAKWNDKLIYLSMGTFPKKVYTMEELMEEKRLEEEQNQQHSMQQDEEIVEEVVEEVVEEDSWEYTDEDSYDESSDNSESYMDEESLQYELEIKNMLAPPMYSEEEMALMMEDQFQIVMNHTTRPSITALESYKTGKQKDATIHFWISQLDGLLLSSLKGTTGLGTSAGMLDNMSMGMDALSGNVIFDKDQAQIDLKIDYKKEVGSLYEKMNGSGLPQTYLESFNHEELLGYFSLNTNMQGFLEAYPSILQYTYGSAFDQYKEEMELAIDFLSCVIDEMAIGELITGDMLFLLHDITTEEVPYVSYDYDEEYNAVEVIKTKTSYTPTFTFMLGSENQSILTKLMRLGVKHQIAALEDNSYYTLYTSALGMNTDTYYYYNDGVAYFTNKKENLNKRQGVRKPNLGQHASALKNNASNFYLNVGKMLTQSDDRNITLDANMQNAILNNCNKMQISAAGIKNNSQQSTITIKGKNIRTNWLDELLSALMRSVSK